MNNTDSKKPTTADSTQQVAKRSKRLPPALRTSKLQEATRRWLIDDFRWQQPYAITLTLKRGTELKGVRVTGDRIRYSQNVRHFLNVLNSAIFGGMARSGWQFSVATFFEQSSEGLPHFHMVLCKPKHLPENYFAWLITHIWATTTWGRRVNRAVPMIDEGWINYITKFKTKAEYDLALELSGVHRCEHLREVPFKLSMKRHTGFLVDYGARVRSETRKFWQDRTLKPAKALQASHQC